MTLHFLHVGKTGGTVIKQALRSAGLPDTPYGPLQLHRAHTFRMRDLPPQDHVFFCLRDPVHRYVSGFYSRRNKGMPRYRSEWTPAEERAFAVFTSPQALAAALASDDEAERRRARRAMRGIRHLRPMTRHVGEAAELEARLEQVVYIARQETLDADWEHIKRLLRLPRSLALPSDPVAAHRRHPALDTQLDPGAVDVLREWYAKDYALLGFCDELRARRGWDAPPRDDTRALLRHWRDAARVRAPGRLRRSRPR